MKRKGLCLLLSAAMVLSLGQTAVFGAGFEAVTAEEGFQPEAVEEAPATEILGGGVERHDAAGEESPASETEQKEGAEPAKLLGDAPTSGNAGGNITWRYADGTLYFEGTGAIQDTYNANYTPWKDWRYDTTRIQLSDGITVIGENAFGHFDKVTSVNIPDGVRIIGEGAFGSCSSLGSVEIPKSVVQIGGSAFSWCESLASVTIEPGVRNLQIGGSAFSKCTSLQEFVFPEGVTHLGGNLFEGAENLRTVSLPEGLESIGIWAFKECGSLQSIVLPGTLKTVEGWLFDGCTSLRSAEISEGITAMNERIFRNCTALTQVTLPSTLEKLPEGTFEGCAALASIELPEGMTAISGGIYGAFTGCTSLRDVTLPSTLKEIGAGTFSGCGSLEELSLPSGLTRIGGSAFYGCKSLRNIRIPARVTSLGSEAFKGCAALPSVTIPSGVEKLTYRLFDGCTSLTEVTIPATVRDMDGYTFAGCTGLTKVYFQGDAPFMRYDYIFQNVIADVYYPKNNATYTDDVKRDHGGRLNWIGHTPPLGMPGLQDAANTAGGIKVSWDKVDGAKGYEVWRKAGSGDYQLLGAVAGTSYTDKKVSAGTEYTYTVQAYRGSYAQAKDNRGSSEYWSDRDEAGMSEVRLTAGKITELENVVAGAKVTWQRKAGAKGYHLYRKLYGGSYARIATLPADTLTYTDTAVRNQNGVVYYYAVRPYSGSSQGAYTSAKTVRLTGRNLTGVTNPSAGRLNLKWAANSKATGYQIYYKTGNTGKIVTIKKNTPSKALTGLKKGDYLVRVRCFKTLGGVHYYSNWGAIKNVKVR